MKQLRALIPIAAIALLAAVPQKDKQGDKGGDGQAGKETGPEAGKEARNTEPYRLSGPFTHQNLSVFLIHGQDVLKGRKLMTLADALQKKKVVVHETGSVNELAIENVSNEEVFVQSGDIVKGGRQDRTLSMDAILPPKSGKVPVSSFCVEHGRWQKRQNESAQRFESADRSLASKALKIASRKNRDQGEVWQKVEEAQAKLTENVKAEVKSNVSSTSLELTLESGDLEKAIQGYVAALQPIATHERDVIGYAFAINGRVNSAEVYGSPELFLKLWPKLLRASAVEAVAERTSDPVGAPKETDVKKLLSLDRSTKAKSKTESTALKNVSLRTVESEDNMLFETRDGKGGDAWVHRSYY